MEANMTNARILSGRGLVHRKLDKRQLACVAANAAQGQTKIDWSVAQLVAALKVSRAYVDLARTFSPEKRQAIIDGLDATSFAALRKAPELQQLAIPAPKRRIVVNGKSIDDATLLQVVRSAGVERTLQAAMAVETAE
jgi:hypothetical protein